MIGKRLRVGDTIGIIAPASVEETDKIKRGIEVIKNLGFNVKEGQYIYNNWGYFAGRDEERAYDLMNMFLDKDVHMILCVRGGYGAMRLLPYIDFEIIKKNPKIFSGYSDITVLLNTFSQETGLISFHGPMVTSELTEKYTIESFINTISNGYTSYTIKNPAHIPMEYYNGEEVMGNLVGGNLCLICSTLGTPYEIQTKNNILFIEEVGETPYKIDRMLTQLLLAGKLQQAKGIILGQFTSCEKEIYDSCDFSLMEVLKDRIFSLKKPTMANFMAGHSYPKITLPIGAEVKLNFDDYSIDVLEPVVL